MVEAHREQVIRRAVRKPRVGSPLDKAHAGSRDLHLVAHDDHAGCDGTAAVLETAVVEEAPAHFLGGGLVVDGTIRRAGKVIVSNDTKSWGICQETVEKGDWHSLRKIEWIITLRRA